MKLLLLTSASKRYPSFETVVTTSNGEDESLIDDMIEKITEYYLKRENYQSVSNLYMNISPLKEFSVVIILFIVNQLKKTIKFLHILNSIKFFILIYNSNNESLLNDCHIGIL